MLKPEEVESIQVDTLDTTAVELFIDDMLLKHIWVAIPVLRTTLQHIVHGTGVDHNVVINCLMIYKKNWNIDIDGEGIVSISKLTHHYQVTTATIDSPLSDSTVAGREFINKTEAVEE